MNKEEIEATIDRFANRYVDGSFGSVIQAIFGNCTQSLLNSKQDSHYEKLFELWQPCGINCSLQQIAVNSEFEKVKHYDTRGGGAVKISRVERLKSKEARELFELLNKIENYE